MIIRMNPIKLIEKDVVDNHKQIKVNHTILIKLYFYIIINIHLFIKINFMFIFSKIFLLNEGFGF
jgi:hypothetical protein